MFKAIGKMLPERLNRLKIKRPVEASLICHACDEILNEVWDHVVPMRAISYRSGMVTVAVMSSAWGHEVSTQTELIKEKTNKRLGGAPHRSFAVRGLHETGRIIGVGTFLHFGEGFGLFGPRD